MRPPVFFIILLLALKPSICHAQHIITGRVLDSKTKAPIPFATIKTGAGNNGTVAGLDGTFQINIGTPADADVSCIGYIPRHIFAISDGAVLLLQPSGSALDEVVVKPPKDKIRRIISNAIAAKNKHNPDKYDWYQCHVYYKMLADVGLPDAVINDTGKDAKEARDFLDSTHLLMTETYSIRTWRQPQQLQEDVLASRFSGLKKSVFTGMVTDVLPFHAYTDYLTLNGKDYHNPISRGYEQYYKFNLSDEVLNGTDTTWILSFTPQSHNANELKGKVYISSAGYAISAIIAQADDTALKHRVRIEQQYALVPVAGSEARWFPKHLNYVIDWDVKSQKTQITYHLTGTSLIDSVKWQEDKAFHFDKAHTLRLADNAAELPDTSWAALRPVPLDFKEAHTYRMIDSIGNMVHADRYIAYLAKLPDGKVPISIFDLDIKRLFAYNAYEHVRLGLGLQTNEKLVRWLSAGGWAGYGFNDTHWKYGAFAELYADKYHEFVFRAGYTDDINDPGRIHLNRDIDKNYLNYYLLQRVDEVKTASLSVKKKFGYWNLELAGRQEHITPKYDYALMHDGSSYHTFTANEVSLGVRYAFAEHTAPMFGYYYSTGSRYPVWYGKVVTGNIDNPGRNIPYTQAVTAAIWHRHVNRVGYEHIMLEGGKLWSNDALPLSKLFAANGYRYDTKSAIQSSLYSFGGMMTVYPYQYYTDQFINLIYRHDFDWKIYNTPISRSLSSAPNICLQYNMLYGTLAHPEAQQRVSISIPDNAYHEAGVLLTNLLRLKYLNICYLSINAGYFYHITSVPGGDKNGRLVFGAGVDL